MKSSLPIVLLTFLLAACSSTTLIRSSDKRASIFVNGKNLGTGTVSYQDSKIMFSKNTITLKKKGCRDQIHNFSRSEEFDVGACVGGLFVLVPWLWLMKYKAIHSYDFTCKKK